MPQLMPLYWNFSFILVLLIIFNLIMFNYESLIVFCFIKGESGLHIISYMW